VAGRSLTAVIIAVVVTVGASAFALGRGAASDSASTTASGTAAAQGPVTAVAIQNFAFSPKTVTVKAGSAVTWTNGDGTAHSVKSADGSFVSQDLEEGQTFTTTFTAPGTHPYVCGIHSSMTATVVVEP
jgi:plastocyanin